MRGKRKTESPTQRRRERAGDDQFSSSWISNLTRVKTIKAWGLGLKSRFNFQAFPAAFEGLPTVYLFWINVINPPVPSVTQKKRVTVRRLQGPCFSYMQYGQSSTGAPRFYISGVDFASAWRVNCLLTCHRQVSKVSAVRAVKCLKTVEILISTAREGILSVLSQQDNIKTDWLTSNLVEGRGSRNF